MIAGYINKMLVYFTQSNGRGIDTQLIELEDLLVLERTLCPQIAAAEMIQAAIEIYSGKIDIENGIVSNGTVWIEGTSKLTHKHVVIPIH